MTQDEPRRVLREGALRVLSKLSTLDNLAKAHEEADKVLCTILVSYDEIEIVNAWKKIGKWYE